VGAAKPLQSVNFDGSPSSGSGGITAWQWSFGTPLYGGGAPASPSASGVHTFTDFTGPGVYPVTLTVTDGAGGTSSVTENVYVSGAGTKNAVLNDVPCSKAVASGGYVDINIPSFAQNPKVTLTAALSGCPGKTIRIVKEEFVPGAVPPEGGGSTTDEWNLEKDHMHVEFVLEGSDSSGEGSATFTASWE
jgi:PKD repeat protein